MPHMLTGGSLIQSSFHVPGQPHLRNFDAVVYFPWSGRLQHYYRINDRPDRPWELGQTINANGVPVTGPGWIIQSSYGREGNFEVVVPEEGGLAHYWHDNDELTSPWRRVGVIAPGATGPGALIQNRIDHSLEMVVMHGRELYHYRLTGGEWVRTPNPITRRASGPPALIQSDYSNHVEVAVQEGDELVLYWRDQEAPGHQWRAGGVLATGVTGPAGFVQGPHGGAHRNFEVVVPQGHRLALFWRDNSVAGLPVRFGGYVAQGVGTVNAAALAVSTLTDKLEVLAQEADHSIFHYYRFGRQGERVWIRAGCLRIDEGRYTPRGDVPLSEKVEQLTGEDDIQRGRPTRNQTLTQCGIRGTDLGASFVHRGRTYCLFGDTHWRGGTPPGTADAIACTTTASAADGLALTFHKSYLRLIFAGEAGPFDAGRQGEYDVPLDGFSHQGQMFVFFSTDHGSPRQPHRKVMGRSVLAVCREPQPDFAASRADVPLDFDVLAEFSAWKFINVAVHKVGRAEVARYDLPDARTCPRGLLIWGTGGYRADNVYLAYVPLDGRPLIEAARARLPIYYFTGAAGRGADWSANEADAVPLFFPAALGELSVRWNAVLRCWVLLYMSGEGDPIGRAVTLRVSEKPWGPWSMRRKVFDWVRDGMGRRVRHQSREGWFIHDPWAMPRRGVWRQYPDDLGDDIIENRPIQGAGGAYAPYQLPQYTEDGAVVTLYYLLSTWNPYQVVLMRHRISRLSVQILLGMWRPDVPVWGLRRWRGRAARGLT